MAIEATNNIVASEQSSFNKTHCYKRFSCNSEHDTYILGLGVHGGSKLYNNRETDTVWLRQPQ